MTPLILEASVQTVVLQFNYTELGVIMCHADITLWGAEWVDIIVLMGKTSKLSASLLKRIIDCTTKPGLLEPNI